MCKNKKKNFIDFLFNICIIVAGPNWKSLNVNSKFSKSALPGGIDADGATLYVGRAVVNDVTLPAKIIPDRQRAYVCEFSLWLLLQHHHNLKEQKIKIKIIAGYNGEEIFVENFEVLKGKEKHYAWMPASHGNVPERAVSTGSENGEDLFVGRAPFEGSMTIGKVHPSHGCIYIPFNGMEVRLPDYEVLIYTKKPSRREKRKEKRKKRRESSSSSSSDSN